MAVEGPPFFNRGERTSRATGGEIGSQRARRDPKELRDRGLGCGLGRPALRVAGDTNSGLRFGCFAASNGFTQR
jgi:hypothetical protein